MKPLPLRRRNKALLVASTALGRHAARAAVSLEDLELIEVCVRGGGLEQGLRRRRVDRVVIELTPEHPELLPEVLGARARAGRSDVPVLLFGIGEPGDGLEIAAAIEQLTGLSPWDATAVLRLWVADLGTIAQVIGESSLARLAAPPPPESHHSYGGATEVDPNAHDTVVEVA